MPAQIVLQAAVSGVLLGLIFSLIAVGVALIWGVMGFINFSHADFMMLGMYSAYWLYTLYNIDPVFSLPVEAVLSFFLGVLVYQFIMSKVVGTSIVVQLFVTFGLMIFIRGVAQFLWSPDYRQIPETLVTGRLQVFGAFIGIPQLLAGAGALVIDVILYWFIQKTETGRALRAVAEDNLAASLMGIPSERMYALAWGLGVAGAGLAGGLISTYYYIYPDVGGVFGLMALVIVAMAFGNILVTFVTSIITGLVVALSGLFIGPAFKYAVVFLFFLAVLLLRRTRE